MNLLNLFGNREVDEWRDEQTLLAARVLNQVAADLIAAFEADVAQASWRDGLIAPGAFLTTRVSPKVREIAEPVAHRLSAEASIALRELIDHQVHWTSQPFAEASAADTTEGWADVAMGVAPAAGGLAIAAALPTVAVTTTGGLLGTGLFASTVIVWPVAVVGGVAATALLATGALNSARVWDKTAARLRRKVADHVGAMLIRGTPKHPAVLEQLAAGYAATAKAARSL